MCAFKAYVIVKYQNTIWWVRTNLLIQNNTVRFNNQSYQKKKWGSSKPSYSIRIEKALKAGFSMTQFILVVWRNVLLFYWVFCLKSCMLCWMMSWVFTYMCGAVYPALPSGMLSFRTIYPALPRGMVIVRTIYPVLLSRKVFPSSGDDQFS